MKIDYRAVAALIPFANNARAHPDGQATQIAGSIRELGWTNPIPADGDNGIMAGHGRLLTVRKLGMSDVPVIGFGGLSGTQKRALVITDNKLALNAGWDLELLAPEFGDLDSLCFDLPPAGCGALLSIEQLYRHSQRSWQRVPPARTNAAGSQDRRSPCVAAERRRK